MSQEHRMPLTPTLANELDDRSVAKVEKLSFFVIPALVITALLICVYWLTSDLGGVRVIRISNASAPPTSGLPR
jgi:hypothetical protein